MYILILSFLTAFILAYFAVPSIISISKDKKLFDIPNERSSHLESTPSLGGIAIFLAVLFSIVFWAPFSKYSELQFVLSSFIIIFLIGAKDDIAPIDPYKKLIGQFLAIAILIARPDIRLTSFHGLFGMDKFLPDWTTYLATVFVYIVIINAFNLIDGINGLAGSVGGLIIMVFGVWFTVNGFDEYAIIAFATIGAILAFLKYNFSPAKIFMGDTGSLLIGIISAILTIKFIELNGTISSPSFYKLQAAPVVAIGILIIPLFDTFRVFITRWYRGHHIFRPDRRHIHHLMIDYGFSHMRTTLILSAFNLFCIGIVLALHERMNMHFLLVLLLIIAVVPTYHLHASVLRKKKKEDLFLTVKEQI